MLEVVLGSHIQGDRIGEDVGKKQIEKKNAKRSVISCSDKIYSAVDQFSGEWNLKAVTVTGTVTARGILVEGRTS